MISRREGAGSGGSANQMPSGLAAVGPLQGLLELACGLICPRRLRTSS